MQFKKMRHSTLASAILVCVLRTEIHIVLLESEGGGGVGRSRFGQVIKWKVWGGGGYGESEFQETVKETKRIIKWWTIKFENGL